MIASPAFYILLLLLSAYLFRHKKQARKALITIAVVLMLFFTCRPIYNLVSQMWSSGFPTEIKPGTTYHYGIVLGGFGEWDEERNRPDFSKHVDRLLEGIQLYHKGAIKTIILASDGSNRIPDDPDDQPGNPIGMRKYIERLGVAPTDLILENKATTTRENAQFLLEQLGDSLKSARPLLITSAEHMRRAVMTFEQAGIPVDPYATDCIIKEKKPKSLFSFTVMNNWQTLLHELLGYIYYRLTI
ncbi:MAG: YdcF family protein [Prevotella sp.]|nr:YdcF family protein [Prevotella sp.]